MDEERKRKRLKKKVLDRWENEGGKLGDAPPGEPPPQAPDCAASNESPNTEERNESDN